MEINQLSTTIGIECVTFSCPTKLYAGYANNQFTFAGEISLPESGFASILPLIHEQIAEENNDYVNLLIDAKPVSIRIVHQANRTELTSNTQALFFKAVSKGSSAALMFSFQKKEISETGAVVSFMKYIEYVADFFALERFYFFARIGNEIVFSQLFGSLSVPNKLNEYAIVTYAHFAFVKSESTFTRALNSLLGIDELELFLAAGQNGFSCIAEIPNISNDILISQNIYLMVAIKNGHIIMSLHGSFLFPFLKNIQFKINCNVAMDSFTLEAYAKLAQPLPLFGPFSIGDTCLSIGYEKGLSFSMFTNLYIRQIQIFGAISLNMLPSGMDINLLSAAISDISLPILIKNLLDIHIPGIECFDFIKIGGLSFQEMKPFNLKEWNVESTANIVAHFNDSIKEKQFQLAPESVQVNSFNKGVSLVDQKRMRHYFIDQDGILKLLAQFYIAKTDSTLGLYTITKGMFLCGVIKLFNLHVEVLFSFRAAEGMTAFAYIQAIDLGFLTIHSSDFSKNTQDLIPLPPGSILHQFIDIHKKGIVFFMTTNKRESNFYLDGKINLLNLFEVNARIIYCSGAISIDTRFELWSILTASLHIKVSYHDFSTGGFEFGLSIDCSGLEKKLRGVQDKINEAIRKYKEKIANANQALNHSQNHVNELYGQINSFNRAIQRCKNEINDASWWEKVFVAISCGIQIGAYEVAKVGIYVAIGIATATLEIAKTVVNVAGAIGETAMQAVNGVISAALNLFFIRKIDLRAIANKNTQSFGASIEFVALGKTYSYSTSFTAGKLKSDPMNSLSDDMNKQMGDNLEDMARGNIVTRSNRNRYKAQNQTYSFVEHQDRLEQGMEQIKHSSNLLKKLETGYVENFKEPLVAFQDINTFYLNAMSSVSGVLTMVTQTAAIDSLTKPVELLRQKLANNNGVVFKDEEEKKVQTALKQYDEIKSLFDKVQGTLTEIELQKKDMKLHNQQRTTASCKVQGRNLTRNLPPATNMGHFINHAEELMYEEFPVERSGKTYINISRESCIHKAFDEARKVCQTNPTEKIEKMKSRASKGIYEKRL